MANYPTVWHLQAAQLNMLNWQMHQQQQLGQWQANLHQALHDTELNARRVSATIGPDCFAAAVLARSWMKRVSGLGAQSFNDFNAKRAWSDAIGILNGAARAASNDGRVGQAVDRHMQLVDTLARFHQGLGGDADAYVGRFRRAFVATREGKPILILAAVVGLVSLVLLCVGSLRPMGVLGLALAAAGVYWGAITNANRARARHALTMAEGYANEYRAFQMDPAQGQWLQQMWQEHRLLFEAPIPDAPAVPQQGQGGSQMFVERKLVERQLVVVRCKFCEKLTPVDLRTCEHCGAPGFGS